MLPKKCKILVAILAWSCTMCRAQFLPGLEIYTNFFPVRAQHPPPSGPRAPPNGRGMSRSSSTPPPPQPGSSMLPASSPLMSRPTTRSIAKFGNKDDQMGNMHTRIITNGPGEGVEGGGSTPILSSTRSTPRAGPGSTIATTFTTHASSTGLASTATSTPRECQFTTAPPPPPLESEDGRYVVGFERLAWYARSDRITEATVTMATIYICRRPSIVIKDEVSHDPFH